MESSTTTRTHKILADHRKGHGMQNEWMDGDESTQTGVTYRDLTISKALLIIRSLSLV
jgi:hypothetical protein